MTEANPVVLVVDDEVQIRRFLRAGLELDGFTVQDAETGADALRWATLKPPDLVILDLGLPDMDGSEVLERLRAWSSVPLIVLSVRSNEAEKVRLLESGADDYVVKPFGIEELLARIRAALRRYSPGDALPPFASKDLSIDFEARQVRVRDRDVHLTPKEYEVLKHLVANQGKPLTHRRLLQAVWGPDYGEETESLRVVINQLRKKLEADPARPTYILTEPWVGYRFQPPRASTAKPAARKG
jgi:two-component system KDP operon response regulator KdpE